MKEREKLDGLNPQGQIPFLKDGDWTLGQGNAILKYLAATYEAGKKFVPEDIQTRATMNSWLDYAATDVRSTAMGVMKVRALWKMFGGPEPSEEEIKVAEEKLAKTLGVVEKQLAGKEYLTGANITLADLRAWAEIDMLTMVLKKDFAEFPNTKAWLDRINALPEAAGPRNAALETLAAMQ